MRPLRWWAESAPPGGDRVKVSENLVAPVDTSLHLVNGLSVQAARTTDCGTVVLGSSYKDRFCILFFVISEVATAEF